MQPGMHAHTDTHTHTHTHTQRTIVHYRPPLAEPTAEEFSAALDTYSGASGPLWVHFEGRNIAEVEKMLTTARGLSAEGMCVSVRACVRACKCMCVCFNSNTKPASSLSCVQ